MASCFDFRPRTSSLDMLQSAHHQKLARFARLFRSRSDPSVKKPPSSPPMSASCGDKAAPRRRFVRIVRDAGPTAEANDLENPHVIHKYSDNYWQTVQSLDDPSCDRPPPYTVSGHTILKKHGSVESNDGSCSPKHASFSESVVIVEYDRCGQVQTGAHATHTQRLNDTDDENSDTDECGSTCHVLSPVSELPPTSFDAVAADTTDSRYSCEATEVVAVHFERSLSTDSESEQPVKKSPRFTTQSIMEKVIDIHLDASAREKLAHEV